MKIYKGGVSNNRIDVGTTGTYWYKIQYAYDGLEFTDDHGTVFLEESIPLNWNNSANRWEYSCIYNTIGDRAYSVETINDKFYGISALLDQVGSQSIDWSADLSIVLSSSSTLS